MWASTGNAEVKARLDHVVAELKRCQDQIGTGYLGGIPKGRRAWSEIAAGNLKADNFGLNGRWVPGTTCTKLYAGLRDAWRYAGNAEGGMLVRLSDWAERLTITADRRADAGHAARRARRHERGLCRRG